MDALAILNAAQKTIIDYANENGISLADHFVTVDAFKTFVFATTVKTLVDAGLTIKEAIDATLGQGQYDALVENVWNAANAK